MEIHVGMLICYSKYRFISG